MRRAGFIEFVHFGVQGTARPCRNLCFVSCFAAAVSLAGCSPASRPQAVEDSLTSGRMTVVCPPEAGGLIAREKSAFQALYPKAVIEVRPGSSRDAVSGLFQARADAAVLTRELEPEERAAAVRGRLEVDGYRFARDALVVIVNPANPVENISLQDLARIYSGTLTDWSEVAGGRGAIAPVAQPPGSDVTAFFEEQVMSNEPIRARVYQEQDDSAVVARVVREPRAIGYITLAWAGHGARALRVASMRGLPYWDPDLEAVYRGDYPLTRFFSYYVRPRGRPLADGFITFITSRDGQKIVHEQGLVPTSVPVRFVRRSPMLSSH